MPPKETHYTFSRSYAEISLVLSSAEEQLPESALGQITTSRSNAINVSTDLGSFPVNRPPAVHSCNKLLSQLDC